MTILFIIPQNRLRDRHPDTDKIRYAIVGRSRQISHQAELNNSSREHRESHGVLPMRNRPDRQLPCESFFRSSKRGNAMNKLISGIAAVTFLAAIHGVRAQQTNQPPTAEPTQPGAAGLSKPGVPGQAGNKSGPTVTPSGRAQENGEQQAEKRNQDETGVQGKAGSKAGPTAAPSGNAGQNNGASRSQTESGPD